MGHKKLFVSGHKPLKGTDLLFIPKVVHFLTEANLLFIQVPSKRHRNKFYVKNQTKWLTQMLLLS